MLQKNGPNKIPNGGIKIPAIKPIIVKLLDILPPPNFFTPKTLILEKREHLQQNQKMNLYH